MAKKQTKHRQGSLHSEMRRNIKQHTQRMSNHTRKSYLRACERFQRWRKESELSNGYVRQNPRAAVELWRDDMLDEGVKKSSIHTYVAGVCAALQIPMDGIAQAGTSADKTKSLGLSRRAQRALERPENERIVAFQKRVGGRRSALQQLRGCDFITQAGADGGMEYYVRFVRDKGGKTQYQEILPEDVELVRSYFESVGADQLLFPEPLDRDLDLHGLRAEHARRAYRYYEQLCATPEGRQKLRQRLWQRYTDPELGCKAYLEEKKRGNTEAMRALRIRFAAQMAEGMYHLRGANRRVALERGLPTSLNRVAVLATSVFSLSHWRNDVCVRAYLL